MIIPPAQTPPPVDCGVCKYHTHPTKECRRHAPHPGHEEDFVIAVWNFTKDRQRCGAGSTKDGIVTCDDCVNWWQPDGKPLAPKFRQGLSQEWWDNSGYCTAAAPGATVHEGRWTFWKVTSSLGGGCGDGKSVTALAEKAG